MDAKWFNVKNKLPEKDIQCLIYDGEYLIICKFYKNKKFFCFEDGEEIKNVLIWCEYPEIEDIKCNEYSIEKITIKNKEE